MKIRTKLAILGAVAAAAVANHAVADDNVFLSPKAKSLQIKHMASTPESTTHWTVAQNGSPKMQSLQPKVAMVTSKNDPDLVKQQRQIVYTGRSPFRDKQQQQQFEIAPLK